MRRIIYLGLPVFLFLLGVCLHNWILIGFRKAGKTTWGRRAADKFGLPFIDTDQLIADDVAAHYREVGEEAFRRHEREVLLSLKHVRGHIIATGGGSVLHGKILSGKVIYLDIAKDELFKRWTNWSEELYCRRRPLYEKMADVTIKGEDELWQVIASDLSSPSPRGENRTDLLSVSSSMDVLQD
jgi:shikimate kinase